VLFFFITYCSDSPLPSPALTRLQYINLGGRSSYYPHPKFGTLFEAAKTQRLRRQRRRGGQVWRRGYPLPIPSPSNCGSMRSVLPQWGQVRSPGRKWILCVLSSTERIDLWQAKTSKWSVLHFDQLVELQRILTLNRDKFGTGFGIRDNSASRMTSYFFGTGPQNSGRMVTLLRRVSMASMKFTGSHVINV